MLGNAAKELLRDAVGTCTTTEEADGAVVPPHDPKKQSIILSIMDIRLVQPCGGAGGTVLMVTFTVCGCGCMPTPTDAVLPVAPTNVACIPYCWFCSVYSVVVSCWFVDTRTYPIPVAAIINIARDTMTSTKPNPLTLEGGFLLDGKGYTLSGIGHAP